MRVFCVFFCFFRAKIWPAAAGTGELARDLRDQTPPNPAPGPPAECRPAAAPPAQAAAAAHAARLEPGEPAPGQPSPSATATTSREPQGDGISLGPRALS